MSKQIQSMQFYQFSNEISDENQQLINQKKPSIEQKQQNSSSNIHITTNSIPKNKYLNKINGIKKELNNQIINGKVQNILSRKQKSISNSLINQNINQDRYSSSNQLNLQPSILDKRNRNKHSAKQSRDRKKLYIQMLEEKQKTLTKRLLTKKKQLQQTKNYLDRVLNQNKTLSGFTVTRQQIIKKMETILKDKQLSIQQRDIEINKVMDNLRYKIGATGKERINTINQYFRQIVNISLPALHRYMMWSASSQSHLFSQNDQEQSDQWYRQLKSVLNLTQQQKKQIMGKKQFLQQQKKILEKLIGKLRKIKAEIQEKSAQLEDLIDGIRQILTPVQCSNFILFIQRNKYRKQLNLYEELDQQSKGKRQRQPQNIIHKQQRDKGPTKSIKTQ